MHSIDLEEMDSCPLEIIQAQGQDWLANLLKARKCEVLDHDQNSCSGKYILFEGEHKKSCWSFYLNAHRVVNVLHISLGLELEEIFEKERQSFCIMTKSILEKINKQCKPMNKLCIEKTNKLLLLKCKIPLGSSKFGKEIFNPSEVLAQLEVQLMQSGQKLKESQKMGDEDCKKGKEGQQSQKLRSLIKLQQMKVFMQNKRKIRQKSSKVSLSVTIIQQSMHRYKDYPQFTQKFRTRNDKKFEQDMQKNIQKIKDEIHTKSTEHTFLMRVIDVKSEKVVEGWKGEEGSYGKIQKLMYKYDLFLQKSIGTDGTIQSFKDIMMQNEDDAELNQVKKIECKGSLIRKIAIGEQKLADHVSEKLILISLRMTQCKGLASYYMQDNSSKQDQSPLYMDEYQADLNYSKLKFLQVMKIFVNLAQALLMLGQYSIIHRDLKPQNIMLDKKCNPKVIDFGSAYYTADFKGALDSRVIMKCTSSIMLVKTTTGYNKYYFQAEQSIQSLYEKQQYQRHRFYDVHAYGALLQKKIQILSVQEVTKQCLQYLKSKCMSENPDDRPAPEDILAWLRYIIDYEALASGSKV